MQQVGLCPLLLFCRIKGTTVKADVSTTMILETDEEKKALDHIKTIFERLVKKGLSLDHMFYHVPFSDKHCNSLKCIIDINH